MLSDLQLLGLGAAAVIDTVLLVALIERPNRRQVALWMLVLTAAGWLWHSGSFVHTLLIRATHPWSLQVNALAMTAMAAGLLLMPSSMLHGAVRLWHTGVDAKPRGDARYGLCYLPVLVLGPIMRSLFAQPTGDFLVLVAPFTVPYVAWLCVTNGIAAITFWDLRRRVALPSATQFFARMALLLCGLSLLVACVVFVAIPLCPQHEGEWKLLVSLSPVLPVLLFTYYVMRFGFVSVVLERTLVYGAVLAAVFLFHHVALAGIAERLNESLQVDFAIVEAVAAAALILAYQPLRQRVAESLRYLLGSRVGDVREQTRQLAARMSDGTDQPIDCWLSSMTDEVRTLFGVTHVGTWLFGEGDHIVGQAASGNAISADQAVALQASLSQTRQHILTRFEAPNQMALEILSATGTSVAIAFHHRDLRGLMVLGRKRLNQELSDEELSSLALLTEQLAVTLRNMRLQQDRLAAERRALRQEKLSTLGLLASSIAHEIKNPLSSIRTISTVMAEDLGPDSPHVEDLRLIVSEIDRLAATTRHLLEFARPAPSTSDGCVPRELLERTLRILRQLAQQRDVRIETEFDHQSIAVKADPASLGEVFFNLLSNSIDAAGAGGVVTIVCRQNSSHVTVIIRDTGPGLPPEVQEHLFEPFVTTKLDGTGLGLYIVGRRIRELAAEIRCESRPGQGTSFEVRLPI